jgi:NADH-quinone oxidoreductase subunit N
MIAPSAYEVARQTLVILLPELLILAVATVVMTAGAFVSLPRRAWAAIAALTLAAATIALIALRDRGIDPYSAVALNDAFSYYSRLAMLLSGLILLGMAHDQVDDARAAEFFGAILMIDAGAMLVGAANELVFLFVGLELVSIPTYLLLYLPRRNASTQEAATKYFFLSIFSSGLLLFGLAYLYGLTGVSNLKALAYLAGHVPGVPQPQLGLIAVVFVMAGLGFRVAAVPFHFYAPDVYQGSPAIMAALLAWVPKAIGFLALLRTLAAVVSVAPDGPFVHRAVMLAWVIAVATMTLGNMVALLQDDLKRLLAYSSIAHAGYLMIGATVALSNAPGASVAVLGAESVLFYLVAYALMTLGVFGLIIALDSPERPVATVDDLSGLARVRPLPALAMALCLFSLAGIPPLAGFYGKFQLLFSAFGAATGPGARLFQWLAILGVLNSAVGAYYYLRIVVAMYLRPVPPSAAPIAARGGWPTALAVGACAVLSLVVGLFPAPVSRASREAAVAAMAQPDPAASEPAARTAAR